jgi:hypothetical protein
VAILSPRWLYSVRVIQPRGSTTTISRPAASYSQLVSSPADVMTETDRPSGS